MMQDSIQIIQKATKALSSGLAETITKSRGHEMSLTSGRKQWPLSEMTG